jgi:hypothetical protein
MSTAGRDHRDVVVGRVLVSAAVLGAAWCLARSPQARQLAWRGVKIAAFSWLPAFVAGQVREAWAASAPAPRPELLGPLPRSSAPAVTAFVAPLAAPARPAQPD